MAKSRKKSSKQQNTLADVDLTKRLDSDRYEAELDKQQTKLRQIQQAYLGSGQSAVIVMEGWDAAGKGGTIRRMSAVLDPRGFKVWPIAAPRHYHLERHYLLRFWERLPPNGAIAVFDRSWYGRVLVERVEGFASPSEWGRAFDEINDFERLLTDDRMRVLKFFLHISPEEQLKRFEARLRDPMKRWKLSYEDFRNRKKWDDYEDATNEMLDRTSTKRAPWHVIAANDKKWARIQILKTITSELAKGMDLDPAPLDEKVEEAAAALFESYKDLIDSTAGRSD
ncbi:polyphosphate kinase 2 family protein [Bauldia litoralis]|uniref:Polyphosphate kinase 2, PPK2 family n=1 Tax=Bauldia litoralis TaxID=665467 RepID=A0A1G6E7K6_9HYPH|nr:polyphosphate kinase [Bauldia litoralis]SDB53419.1 Polyphosphate kinase 2, PPK2 family [Bauldia litoralis]